MSSKFTHLGVNWLFSPIHLFLSEVDAPGYRSDSSATYPGTESALWCRHFFPYDASAEAGNLDAGGLFYPNSTIINQFRLADLEYIISFRRQRGEKVLITFNEKVAAGTDAITLFRDRTFVLAALLQNRPDAIQFANEPYNHLISTFGIENFTSVALPKMAELQRVGYVTWRSYDSTTEIWTPPWQGGEGGAVEAFLAASAEGITCSGSTGAGTRGEQYLDGISFHAYATVTTVAEGIAALTDNRIETQIGSYLSWINTAVPNRRVANDGGSAYWASRPNPKYIVSETGPNGFGGNITNNTQFRYQFFTPEQREVLLRKVIKGNLDAGVDITFVYAVEHGVEQGPVSSFTTAPSNGLLRVTSTVPIFDGDEVRLSGGNLPDTFVGKAINATSNGLSFDVEGSNVSMAPAQFLAVRALLGGWNLRWQAAASAAEFPWPRIINANNFLRSGLRGVNGYVCWGDLPDTAYVDKMQAWGIQASRTWLPIVWDGSTYTASNYDGTPHPLGNTAALNRLDSHLAQLTVRKIYAVIVVSITVSAHMPWTEPRRSAFKALWQTLATRWNNNHTILGFDLLNEPTTSEAPEFGGGWSPAQVEQVGADWEILATECTDIIRAVDPDRCIIYEAGLGGNPWFWNSARTLLPRLNIVYSPHCYIPYELTHQNLTEYFSGNPFKPDIGYGRAEEQSLVQTINTVFNWQPNIPLLVGEFSCVRYALSNGAVKFVSKSIELFESIGASWLYHEFRGAPVWDPEGPNSIELTYTRSDTGPVAAALRTALDLTPGQFKALPEDTIMPLTFSSALASTLSLAPSRTAWAIALTTALGSSRTITAKWAPSGDAWLGTTFWAAPLVGSATANAGEVTSLGSSGPATTQAAIDLAGGNAVVRFSSADGNNWVQGTLGLPGSGTDFIVQSNPTAQTGFGTATTWKLLAPSSLPLVEPSPPLDNAAPAIIEVWNWQNPSSPVLVGSTAIDFVQPDMEFEDPLLAAEIGKVGMRRTSTPVTYDGFKFAAQLYVMRGSLNLDVPGTPVYELTVSAGEPWPGYPAQANYNAAIHSTIPKACKVLVYNAFGGLLHTWQRQDGSALNSQTTTDRSPSKRLEPWWNCAQPLFWNSAKIKPSGQIDKWVPNKIPEWRGANIARDLRQAFSANGSVPLLTGGFQLNGVSQWMASPRWALPEDAQAQSPNSTDPFMFATSSQPGAQWLAIGWDYEPGPSGCHDVRYGAGGTRFDRAPMAEPYALFATDRNYIRPKDSVPIYDLAWAWAKNEYNEAYYYISNATTVTGISKSQSLEPTGGWAQSDGYYGGGTNFVPGGTSRHINTFGISNGSNWPAPDKDGKRHYNGYMQDGLHNYNYPAWATLLLNSPSHTVAQKFRLDSALMAMLGDRPVTGITNWWGQREHAWRWSQYIMTWITGTNSSLTYSRAEIETLFQAVIEAEYDVIYTRAIINNEQNFTWQALRQLGVFAVQTRAFGPPGQVAVDYGQQVNQMMYIGLPLMLMKRSGLWDIMRAKSLKCQRQMDFHLECLTKLTCDMILATDGRCMPASDFGAFNYNGQLGVYGSTPTVPSTWTEWNTLFPAAGQEDFVRKVDGSFGERDGLMHMYAQFASIRKYFFNDVLRPADHSAIDAAVTKYRNYYTAYRAANQGFVFGLSSFGMFEGV